MFRALGGSTIDTLDIISPQYTGAEKILDLSAIGAGDVDRVTVSGGQVGTNVYIQCKAGAAAGTGNIRFAWWAEV